jgi:class 3 adenylate cyclase
MRAWTVDADDIRVAEDFDEALLHRTPEIDSFLDPNRDDKFIVIGTKGFGKTLLLKAKRILYQREGRAACLPAGNLLDKPIGDKIFSREAIGFFATSSLPWSKVWLAAIALTVLKHLGRASGLEVHRRLGALIADEHLLGVVDHFVRLLELSPSDLQRCAIDTDGHLVPRLRSIQTPVAIFIDGVDEYFNKHIEGARTRASVTGQLSPSVWYYSQLGLVEVAYQLRRVNHHLKVFAAVRKEAYARLPHTTVMSQQYRGSAVDIGYSIESLREIFINNIRLEKSDRMVRAGRVRTAPLEAFFGRATITHTYTREEEDVFDYVCRHTLLRPRDLMTVGQRLAMLRPEERADQERVKVIVNQAATDIAHEYLAEIAPYVGELGLAGFLRRIPRHILTREKVEELFREHTAADGGLEEKHIFCALYRVGLLGAVHHDWVRGQVVQRFLRPGEGTLEPDGVLPRATHYFVHPALSDVIGRMNPSYLDDLEQDTIIGYGRPWQETDRLDGPDNARKLCVLKGDVHGFGGLMLEGNSAPVIKALNEAVSRWAKEAIYADVGAGDAVLIVHEDAAALAQIARHIMDEVYRAPGHARLRIALHHGEVRLRWQQPKPVPMISGGEAILRASRVEPFVEPGQIWATEEFRERLSQKPSLWRTTLVPGPGEGDSFNVQKKGGTEPNLWVRLHRLEF